MKKKNLVLMGIVVVLLAANILVSGLDDLDSSYSFDRNLFAISDTAAVSEITFSGKAGDIILSNEEAGWMVNHTYRADEGLRKLLLSILARVEVRRPVQTDQLGAVQVTVKTDENVQFEVFGNATKTKTYFSQDGLAYEVEIPGYSDYLGSIFELTRDQWRDRLLFDGNWRSIQKLELVYTDGREGFRIEFSDQFFLVEGSPRIDSNLVVDYLNRFDYFQANELIDLSKFPKYEALAASGPSAKLTVESIHYSAPFILSFYPMSENERIGLVSTNSGDWAVIDRKRILNLLVEKDFFSYRD